MPAATPVVVDGDFQGLLGVAKTVDLMTHLQSIVTDRIAIEHRTLSAKEKKLLDQFVAQCRKYLDENPPVQIRYMDVGMGLVLQNGFTVSLKTQSMPGPDNTSFPINKLASQPGQGGISDTSSIPIFSPNSQENSNAAAPPPRPQNPPQPAKGPKQGPRRAKSSYGKR